mmetsp:Transcript_10509/g.10878  ORF Transcript_10509/g.10878 Transcript_10509/m.10878 type:complete len:97 (+) Transcript_10509:164-454(+)
MMVGDARSDQERDKELEECLTLRLSQEKPRTISEKRVFMLKLLLLRRIWELDPRRNWSELKYPKESLSKNQSRVCSNIVINTRGVAISRSLRIGNK